MMPHSVVFVRDFDRDWVDGLGFIADPLFSRSLLLLELVGDSLDLTVQPLHISRVLHLVRTKIEDIDE